MAAFDSHKHHNLIRRLSEELEECGEGYCNYKHIKIQDLEHLLVQNIKNIRSLLIEFFKLRDFRTRQAEKSRGSIQGVLGSAIKRSKKFLSSKNFEHMDSIIEEYININYI